MLNFLKKLVREEEGQDFVEYALLLTGVSIVLLTGSVALTDAVAAAWGTIAAAL